MKIVSEIDSVGTDIVPIAALIPGFLSFILPFASLKENRVVDGIGISGFGLSSPLIGVFSILVAAVILFAAFRVTNRKYRRLVYGFAGIACFWLAAALLARGDAFLPAGSSARVSPILGFWGLPMASYILLDHSQLSRQKGASFVVAVVLLIPSALLLFWGGGSSVSIFLEWSARKSRFFVELLTHVKLFGIATFSAAVLGIPIGILASRSKHLEAPLTSLVDAFQTIPSLALFGLLMVPLAALSRTFPALRTIGIRGIGATPALIALTMYALLPIVRNTLTGLATVPEPSLEAGRGMGMSGRQLFWTVRLPLAMPHILTGLRTASVQAVGNTAVAALIGAGGLGMMIFQGLGQAAPDLVLLGVIPLILIAVFVDRFWGFLILKIVSPGLRLQGSD